MPVPDLFMPDEHPNIYCFTLLGLTIIFLAYGFDIIKNGYKNLIHGIPNMDTLKIQTIMLTGDNKLVAEKIAHELALTQIIANVFPSEKANKIKELKQEGKKVIMCGDGINDSPALANSDIGISVKSGTDIAMDSSDVILTKNDLNSILKLIKISERTVRNIKQNLFWAFFYNCWMIPIAIGILKPIDISITPMIASFMMVISSITVCVNTLRLKRIKI